MMPEAAAGYGVVSNPADSSDLLQNPSDIVHGSYGSVKTDEDGGILLGIEVRGPSPSPPRRHCHHAVMLVFVMGVVALIALLVYFSDGSPPPPTTHTHYTYTHFLLSTHTHPHILTLINPLSRTKVQQFKAKEGCTP
jgi:hypothetical protein